MEAQKNVILLILAKYAGHTGLGFGVSTPRCGHYGRASWLT